MLKNNTFMYTTFSNEYLKMLDNIIKSDIPYTKIEYYKVISPISITYDDNNFIAFIAALSNVLVYKALLNLIMAYNTSVIPIYINKSQYINVDIYEKYYHLGVIEKGNTIQIKYNNIYAKSYQINDQFQKITNSKLFDILENGNAHFGGLQILNNIRNKIYESLDLIYNILYKLHQSELNTKSIYEIANYIYLSKWSDVQLIYTSRFSNIN